MKSPILLLVVTLFSQSLFASVEYYKVSISKMGHDLYVVQDVNKQNIYIQTWECPQEAFEDTAVLKIDDLYKTTFPMNRIIFSNDFTCVVKAITK